MALEKYHFVSADGNTKIDVHFLNDKLSYRKAKKIRDEYKDRQDELGDAFMEAALTPEELEKVENLSLRDYTTFMQGWMESEGNDLGES